MDIDHDEGNTLQLAIRLVRYALACEHSRTQIRRDKIKEKVLGPNNSRKFKPVFEEAQRQLRNVFGMVLEELPARDHEYLTAIERKKKMQTGKQKSSNSWILKSILPEKYRVPAVIPPSKAPTEEYEASYVGFYSMIIALITLKGGELDQNSLDRHLTRLNANAYTPIGKTSDVLSKLQRQGYIDKVVHKVPGDDDQISYIVGPRGKAELTSKVIENMIREVYGDNKPADFETRLAISLKQERDDIVDGAEE